MKGVKNYEPLNHDDVLEARGAASTGAITWFVLCLQKVGVE